MFTFSNALKSICRHSRKSALYFLICVIAVLTLQIYMAGIDKTEKQLLQLPAAIPISASVASLDGTRFDGLQIQETTVDGLLHSAHVRDLQLTVLLRCGIGDFSPKELRKYAIWGAIGTNTTAALEGLETDSVTWLPGYGPDVLTGAEAVCLMDSHLMEINGWTLGDTVPLNLYYYLYGSRGTVSYEPVELVETRIVGAADLRSAVTNNSADVVIPFEYGRAVFHNQGIAFHASSASFYVRDALALNTFKAEMKTLSLSQVSSSGDAAIMVLANQGAALLVNDAAFISSATRLQESLSLLKGFFPLLAAVLAAIGYFVAYLMIQNRREEYAVHRLLGMSRRKSMGLYFTEITALTLSGSLFGVFLATAFSGGSFSAGVTVFLLFSLCFMLGSFIALLRLGRTNVMLALAQPE
ncbi:FtsX-like permease family protein [Sporobacter termitidis DSM 10068]|uniref:FtsX-like permease family protein n=1 Tax=Sporobacter termitidis DSM 10068 TaxID=1123282 RepID=A0A1M5WBI3_9FIRM|nr:ABC transporter permease [Sporobacter termitidis]SHH84810.1 FtsX-like permease family protein [Sporobacter termitidis DSM 10068]